MSNQYHAAVLAKGPVAYWRLGDAPAMTAVDQTGNGHDGAYRGPDRAPTTGRLLQATRTPRSVFRSFYVGEIPDSGGFQPAGPAARGRTVEAWFPSSISPHLHG